MRIARMAWVLLAAFAVSAASMAAEEAADSGSAPVAEGAATTVRPTTPIEQVSDKRSWEYGPFLNYGNGVGDRTGYHFVWGGVEAGKILTPVIHAGPLSGQFQLAANIMPLWTAFTPAAHSVAKACGGATCDLPYGGGNYVGASITPAIFRWNFHTHSSRWQPWFQAAGGLIYTTHKFPPDQLVTHGSPGATSVWNFTPQGGVGLHYFTRPGRSLDFGLNAVHISSASLGDRNPGVNASLQFQVGYTIWK